MTILFLFSKAFAANYYVSNAGSDSNNGTNEATPWQTVSKVNGFTFSAGDTIYFKRGNTWNEKLIVPIGYINFDAYGSGANPIITGFQTQSVSLVTGNIYRGIATNAVNNLNLVLINGVVAHKARYPNTGWLTFTGHSGDSSITGTLTGNHAGFQLAVRTTPWIIDTISVLSQSGGTLNLNGHLTYPPAYQGNGYFLQRNFPQDSTLVDTLNEFSYNSTSKALNIYSLTTPTVQVSTIDTLVYVGKKNGVKFSNIQFQGANAFLIFLDSSNNTEIKNCNFNYCGGNGIDGHAIATNFTSDTITNILNIGIKARNAYVQDLDSTKILNCLVKNIGFIAGMGANGNSQSNGIETCGDDISIRNTRIDSCGNNGIEFIGKRDTVYNCYITNWAFIKSDAGAIRVASYAANGSLIRANICENGIGAIAGTSNGVLANAACGIYLDENADSMMVDSNTVYNCFQAGIFLHNVTNDTILANTVYGGVSSYALSISGIISLTNSNVVKKNLLFALPGQIVTARDTYDVNEIIDSNYISRWPSEGNLMYNQGSVQSLSLWRNATGWDRHSGVAPVNITSDLPIYYSNPTNTPVTYASGQTMTDFYGNSANSFTVEAYKSVILFSALNQIVPVVPPGLTTNTKAHYKNKNL